MTDLTWEEKEALFIRMWKEGRFKDE